MAEQKKSKLYFLLSSPLSLALPLDSGMTRL